MQITRKEYEYHITSQILETIYIERNMDRILANYFCQDKERAEDFSNLILYNERITFEFKKDMICNIINNNYKEFKNKHPEFISLISKIPEHRNRFAHLVNMNNVERTKMIEDNAKIWSGVNPEIELKDPTIELIVFKRYKNGKPKYIGYNREDLFTMQKNLIVVLRGLQTLSSMVFEHPDLPLEEE